MTTLVLDDLCPPQRDMLSAMPVLERCEWGAPGGVGFAAFFASLGASRATPHSAGVRERQDSQGLDRANLSAAGAGA